MVGEIEFLDGSEPRNRRFARRIIARLACYTIVIKCGAHLSDTLLQQQDLLVRPGILIHFDHSQCSPMGAASLSGGTTSDMTGNPSPVDPIELHAASLEPLSDDFLEGDGFL